MTQIIYQINFSTTGTMRKIVEAVTEGLTSGKIRIDDLTLAYEGAIRYWIFIPAPSAAK